MSVARGRLAHNRPRTPVSICLLPRQGPLTAPLDCSGPGFAHLPVAPGAGHAPPAGAMNAAGAGGVAVAFVARHAVGALRSPGSPPRLPQADAQRSLAARRRGPARRRLRDLGGLPPGRALACRRRSRRRRSSVAAAVARGRWRCRRATTCATCRPPVRLAVHLCAAAVVRLVAVARRRMRLPRSSPSALRRDRRAWRWRSRGRRISTTSWTAATASPATMTMIGLRRLRRRARLTRRRRPPRSSRWPRRRCRFSPSTARRATMFLGDVGSVPLGFLAAAFGIAGALTGAGPRGFRCSSSCPSSPTRP